MDQTNSESIVNDLRVRVAALEGNTEIERLRREIQTVTKLNEELYEQRHELRTKLAAAERLLREVREYCDFRKANSGRCRDVIRIIDAAKRR